MGLRVYLERTQPTTIYSRGITHNLVPMAEAAGLYNILWRPEELGIRKAKDIITRLKPRLEKLKENRKYYEQFNPANGWGSYENLVDFVEEYLQQCIENPDASIIAER